MIAPVLSIANAPIACGYATRALHLAAVRRGYLAKQLGHANAGVLLKVNSKRIDGADNQRERAKLDAAFVHKWYTARRFAAAAMLTFAAGRRNAVRAIAICGVSAIADELQFAGHFALLDFAHGANGA
jgi:hypothetical protein